MHDGPLPDELQECLQWFRHRDFSDSVTIHEKAQDGKGSVTFRAAVPVLLDVPLARGSSINWLSDGKCADGLFFEWLGDGLRAHIVELKRSVDLEIWERKIKGRGGQFAGMLKQAVAAAALLGWPLRDVVFYTAYRYDNLSPTETATLGSFKIETGGSVDEAPEQDWLEGAVDVLRRSRARHVRIPCEGDMPFQGEHTL